VREGVWFRASTLGIGRHFVKSGGETMPERKDNLIAERLLDGGSKMEFDDAKLVVKATPRSFLAFFCGLPYYSAGSSARSKHTCIHIE
jgi:hypothetical protein